MLIYMIIHSILYIYWKEIEILLIIFLSITYLYITLSILKIGETELLQKNSVEKR